METGDLWGVEVQISTGTGAEIQEKGSSREDLEDARRVEIRKVDTRLTEHAWSARKQQGRGPMSALQWIQTCRSGRYLLSLKRYPLESYLLLLGRHSEI